MKAGRCLFTFKPLCLHIDDEVDHPMFKIGETHYAATWLRTPGPQVEMPAGPSNTKKQRKKRGGKKMAQGPLLK